MAKNFVNFLRNKIENETFKIFEKIEIKWKMEQN